MKILLTFFVLPILSLIPTTTDTIRPAANGSIIENLAIGGDNFECVDEAAADQLTYVRTFDTAYKTDLFIGVNDIPLNAIINSVTIYFRVRGIQTQIPGNGITKVKPTLRENGLISYGSEITPTSNVYTTYSETFNVRPSDGSNWTVSDINNLEFGISQRATSPGGNSPRTTQIFITVNYN